MDQRSGFWQVDPTRAAQELLAFVTPKGRVFRWKVMPFGVANAPALFQELMNKDPWCRNWLPAGLKWRPTSMMGGWVLKTQRIISSSYRNFFTICQENHLRIKLEKCEFMCEEMEYLGFDVGYGW